MKKIIKILVGIASIIGLTALIKHLFFNKKEVIEISISDEKKEVEQEEIVEEEKEIIE